MSLTELFEELHSKEIFFRFENDEDGFIMSIISRKTYPRIWGDNLADNQFVINCESVEHLEQRITLSTEIDWSQRFYAKNVESLSIQVVAWLSVISNPTDAR